MSERIRFHLDEHMDPDIAAALRKYGVDVTLTQEAGLRTRDDDSHFNFIRAQQRVIVTDDTDFLRLAQQTSDHPGVAFCRRSQHSVGEIIKFLLLIYEVLDPSDMVGRVEYL